MIPTGLAYQLGMFVCILLCILDSSNIDRATSGDYHHFLVINSCF